MAEHPLLAALPAAVAERTRLLRELPVPASGAFVLYWMRTAMRGHENPALDAALALAARLSLPAFVYQGLSERYPYASDRHHTFILEGARDAAAELTARGVGHAFHLERPRHRGPHLKTLASQAAVVVTEDFPYEPLRSWTHHLARDVEVPLLLVDTACVLPAQLIDKPYDRAFAFRAKTGEARLRRARIPWEEAPVVGAPFVPPLPFEPVALATAPLPGLVAACEIDHLVGPVPETPGGAVAGYARWDRFRKARLAAYARHRDDPTRDGASRMSPYLHHGMVSPLRLAREASASGGDGAHKFLDELLTWRELAHLWCLHTARHDDLSAIPAWARESLQRHERDARPQLPSWERLARGHSGDALWDACQRSLLAHGELHNSVRMTWGKALLSWTRSASEALALLTDLNHRYALDGRDPSSSGGLLWCLGQFDRPFTPESEVLGQVRPRPTLGHAERFDLSRFEARVARPTRERPRRIGVIGAGMAGLVCARALRDHQLEVVVFDKGSGVGGRLATRRTEHGTFDHGAQFLTAHDPRFARHVASWHHEGLLARWDGRLVDLEHGEATPHVPASPRYVGVPDMNALARHLAADLQVRSGCELRSVRRDGNGWHLLDAEGQEHGPFEVLLINAPGPQAAKLLADVHPVGSREAAGLSMAPAWAVLCAFASPLGLPFDAAHVHGSPLAWAASGPSRPGRSGEECWVLHGSRAFSRGALESEPAPIAATLRAAFQEATGRAFPTPVLEQVHRWRYAFSESGRAERCFWDGDAGLGLCGDGWSGPTLEAAFLSGSALAGRVLGMAQPLHAPAPEPSSLGPLFG